MNKKNRYMLEKGRLHKKGYDWWWHSFTGYDEHTGEERSFFIEYYVINPGLCEETPTFGLKGETPCYAMIKAGSWGKGKKQLHKMYPISEFGHNKEPFFITIGKNLLQNNMLIGDIKVSKEDAENHPEYMSDYGTMKWHLQVKKDHTFDVGYGANNVFSHLGLFKMFWHAEGVKSRYSGYVEYDGHKYIVDPETSYGYQDKNWGSDYTNPWLWLNSSNLRYKGQNDILENTYFDFGGGRPVILGVPLQGRILGVFSHQGKTYEYNFSKPKLRTKEEFNSYEDELYRYWDITCQNKDSKLEINFKAKKDDLLLVKYENPKGEVNHTNLYNGGTAFGEVKLYEKQNKEYNLVATFEGFNGGCEYGEY